MEPSCVRHNQIPGTTRLFEDFVYHPDRVSAFYPSTFADPAALRATRDAINFPDDRRRALVAALREQNGDSPALDQLADPATVAVVTGQQVGLLSGPCYTIFKALTAVKLAQQLRQDGIPAVPVFWLATEDHDLAEVDHAWIFDRNTNPVRISLANTLSNGGPVGNVVLENVPLDEIRGALEGLPFAGEVCDRIAQAYSPGATLGAAFKSLLQDLLRGCGLLYLDPLFPAIREMARPFIEQCVDRLPGMLSQLKARDRELAAAGYHAQVHLEDGASLLFLLSEGKRIPLRWADGRFTAKDRSFDSSELRALAGQLSPNALLRPVMQDFLLPTVSYIGGPSEIAYMAQGQVLYRELLGRMPVLFPRNSFTLLDERARKILDRYRLQVHDILDHQEKVKSTMAAQLVPPGLMDQFASLDSAISGAITNLQSSLHQFDPTLESAARKSSSKMRYQLQKLAQKTARETLRKDERSVRDANYLINLIYPHRRLQERFYSIVPFLARHGLDLPARISEMTQVTCPDHMVRTI